MFAACDGNGQAARHAVPDERLRPRSARAARRNPQYVYVRTKESKPYFDMAHEWVLADRMFLAARRELRRAPIHHRGAGAIERQRPDG